MKPYLTIENEKITDFPASTLKWPCSPGSYNHPSFKAWYPLPKGTAYLPDVSTVIKKSDPTKGRLFAKEKKNGTILMSEYENTSVVTQSFLSTIHHVEKAYASYPVYDPNCQPPRCAWQRILEADRSWTANFSLEKLSNLDFANKDVESEYRSDIDSAVSSTQQAAYASSLNGYDLLTELAEARETFTWLGSKVGELSSLLSKVAHEDEQAWKKGRQMNAKKLLASSDAGLRRLGKRWMEYRYALMPLVYSFTDVAKVLKERESVYHSERAKNTITVDIRRPSDAFDSRAQFLYYEGSGSIEVRSLTKAMYTRGALQRLAAVVGFNPFRTAYELVPLSFVLDWAINLGDVIAVTTGIDYSSDRMGCTVVKRNYVESIGHYYDKQFVTGGTQLTSAQCPSGPTPPLFVHKRLYENIVQTSTVNGYVRTLFKKPTPKVELDLFLNWKRSLDSIALLHQPVKKLLRSLK